MRPLRLRRLPPASALIAAAIGAIVFWLAYDGGSYGLESRTTTAIAVWWSILLAVILGLWPLVRTPAVALVVGGLLGAFAILAAVSIAWAPSAERAFAEFNRTTLYVGIFLLAVFAGSRGNVGRIADGIATGLSAIGVLALTSRLFPDVMPAGQVPEFLPAAYTRLSWPVEYWNGLAILVALAFPLLLRVATATPPAAWGALAVAAFPPLVGTMYLTSSRGGFATALIGVTAFLVLTPRRWAGAAAVVLGGLGSAAAVAILASRDALTNDPYRSPEAVGQGRSAALLILAVCGLVAAAHWLGTRYLADRVRLPARAGWVAVALVVAAVAVLVVAAEPVERAQAFTEPPPTFERDDFVTAHLLSGTGSGRWQFWGAAVDQWQTRPLLGRGAGTYEAWWAEHGPIAHFIRDAHSLYLETLGELGLVGLLLLVGALGTALVAALRRLRASRDEERLVIAALVAAFVAYAAAAGFDWMWELTVVSVIGMTLLGLLVGPATAAGPRLQEITEPSLGDTRRTRARFAAGVATVVVGWLLICAQAIPFLSSVKISDSQAAARGGDLDAALRDAGAARQLQPWAATPHLQLALVEEEAGAHELAIVWIDRAIDRDPQNWRLWLVAARIETAAGNIEEARRRLRRAAALNPRSPLFARVE